MANPEHLAILKQGVEWVDGIESLRVQAKATYAAADIVESVTSRRLLPNSASKGEVLRMGEPLTDFRII
jgi:hypothetical protein